VPLKLAELNRAPSKLALVRYAPGMANQANIALRKSRGFWNPVTALYPWLIG
jgi:hypothetical protein